MSLKKKQRRDENAEKHRQHPRWITRFLRTLRHFFSERAMRCDVRFNAFTLMNRCRCYSKSPSFLRGGKRQSLQNEEPVSRGFHTHTHTLALALSLSLSLSLSIYLLLPRLSVFLAREQRPLFTLRIHREFECIHTTTSCKVNQTIEKDFYFFFL